jgi:hypothetical protein
LLTPGRRGIFKRAHMFGKEGWFMKGKLELSAFSIAWSFEQLALAYLSL